VLDKHVPFLEAAGVQEEFDPLAGSHFALGVLLVDTALAAAQAGRCPFFVKFL